MKNRLIIFSHYYVDKKVINTFDNVKLLNPEWDIVPIGFENYELLENSLIIKKDEYPSNKDIQYYDAKKRLEWYEGDLCLYDCYLKLPNYEEYFLYEYDTICNVSIRSFFNTNVDFFGNNIDNPIKENKEWVTLYRKHNSYNYYFDKFYSCGQTTALYFKNKILKQCTEELIENKIFYDNMFSEVRCGTLVNKFTNLIQSRSNIKEYISWKIEDIILDFDVPYFYHPVK